jgi:hypothetical protein
VEILKRLPILGMQAFVCLGALESDCPFLFHGSSVAPYFRASSLDGLACSKELPIYGIEIWVGGRRLELNAVVSTGRRYRRSRVNK